MHAHTRLSQYLTSTRSHYLIYECTVLLHLGIIQDVYSLRKTLKWLCIFSTERKALENTQ